MDNFQACYEHEIKLTRKGEASHVAKSECFCVCVFVCVCASEKLERTLDSVCQLRLDIVGTSGEVVL